MSGVTRPTGPLPARVYWVRRALVLGTAFVLVFALARLLGGGSEEPAANGAQAEQASGNTTREVEAAPDAKDTATGQKVKKKKKVQPSLPMPDGICAPEEVRISPEIRSEPAGGPRIKIPLTVTTDRVACTFVLSASTAILKITSGRDNIWSSQQCPAVLGERKVIVRSMKPARLSIVWNGQRSAESCAATGKWAMPGGYHAVAASLGGEPVDQYFELTVPEGKVITKVREPKKKDKKKQSEESASNSTNTDSDRKPDAGASPRD